MRINRYLARAGVTSRRKAEELITAGKVCINGQTITELATDVNPAKDTVELGGEIIELPSFKYYALNKPAGYTCTKEDTHAEHTVFELLPADPSLITVGRLDKETTGLILVTNDGDFTQNIIHPSNKIRKTYLVNTKYKILHTNAEELLKGVQLEDGPACAVDVKIINENNAELTIEEGRNRIVRRMIAAIGNEVVALQRTQIGDIKLDTRLGEYRELTPEEAGQYA